MKPFPIVISFYTQNTLYEEEVKNLLTSCKKFELETSVEKVQSFGNWELNCAYKPFFIFKKMDELKKPLLWVDADGKFLRAPRWQNVFDSDLALRLDADLPADHPSKVISSTIYINNTMKARDLIRDWMFEAQKILLDKTRKEEFWDQIALRNSILKNRSSCKVASLPLSYAKIFDHPGDNEKVEDAVIEHYQASRRI